MIKKKSCRLERSKFFVNTKTISTYKTYKCCKTFSPFTLPLGTVKPCFVSEKVTRAYPRTVRFDKILDFWATIVIQTFYILSEKSFQQSTLLGSFGKHFCIHYKYVVKDSKHLLITQLSTTPRNFM